MKTSKNNRFEDFEPINCEACGHEHLRSELDTIVLHGFNSIIKICKSCKVKGPEEQYESAASTLKIIACTINDKSSPEERLEKIRNLLR